MPDILALTFLFVGQTQVHAENNGGSGLDVQGCGNNALRQFENKGKDYKFRQVVQCLAEYNGTENGNKSMADFAKNGIEQPYVKGEFTRNQQHFVKDRVCRNEVAEKRKCQGNDVCIPPGCVCQRQN